jgi:electron transfer flavoprotein alpha subunit
LANIWDLLAVTIDRAYLNGASADFFERLYDACQAVKLQVTGKPLAFKRFVKGGNIIAMNSEMEATQVLGAARSFFKSNDPEISADTPAEEVGPEFSKLCTTHGKR